MILVSASSSDFTIDFPSTDFGGSVAHLVDGLSVVVARVKGRNEGEEVFVVLV